MDHTDIKSKDFPSGNKTHTTEIMCLLTVWSTTLRSNHTVSELEHIKNMLKWNDGTTLDQPELLCFLHKPIHTRVFDVIGMLQYILLQQDLSTESRDESRVALQGFRCHKNSGRNRWSLEGEQILQQENSVDKKELGIRRFVFGQMRRHIKSFMCGSRVNLRGGAVL